MLYGISCGERAIMRMRYGCILMTRQMARSSETQYNGE